MKTNLFLDLNKPSVHQFEKVNLTGIKDKKGIYDLYRCKQCGIDGKRYGFSSTILITSIPDEHVFGWCIFNENSGKEYIGRLIKVTDCRAVGQDWKNCTPESIHVIVNNPSMEKPNMIDGGCWIKGVSGNPVKLLSDEFVLLPKIKRTK